MAQANEIPAGLWLEVMEGIRPVRTSSGGDEHFYHSPLRSDDKTPSFVWSASKNVWIDNGTNEAGRTFDLVKILRSATAGQALQIIRNSGLRGRAYEVHLGEQRHLGSNTPRSTGRSLELLSASELRHPALLKYLNVRAINIDIARKYLKEVHYQTTSEQHLFAVGIPTQTGGHAISSPLKVGKGFVGPHLGFSHLNSLSGPEILVFEGFIDALSFMSMHYRYQDYPTLILNSTNMAAQAIDVLRGYEAVQLWLDDDSAGDKATDLIQQEIVAARDMRKHFGPSVDVNAWICGKNFER